MAGWACSSPRRISLPSNWSGKWRSILQSGPDDFISGRKGLTSDRQNDHIILARCSAIVCGDGIETFFQQGDLFQPGDLELPKPRLLIGAPDLVHIQRADKKVAVTLEDQMRRQFDDGPVIARFHGLPAGDSLNQGHTRVA